MLRRRLLFLIFAMMSGPVWSAEFVSLGFWPGFHGKDYFNVSSDGDVVVSRAVPEDVNSGVVDIVRWTYSSGTETLLTVPSHVSVSSPADASIIVSTRRNEAHELEPIRITDAGVEALPSSPEFASPHAAVVSHDGRVIWGTAFHPRLNTTVLMRWDEEEVFSVMTSPNPFPAATSNSGDIVVGFLEDPRVAGYRAFRWTEGTGEHELPGAETFAYQRPYGLSSNGRWAVGEGYNRPRPLTDRQALRWDGLDTLLVLEPARGSWGAVAIDVTSDGRTIVGQLNVSDEPVDRLGQFVAGIWTEDTGVMSPLQELLASHHGLGKATSGFHLTTVHDITDDGRYMVGSMISRDGDRDAFWIDLGLRGDFNSDEILDINDVDALSHAIQSSDQDLKFDLNYSNAVDSIDLRIWVKELEKTWFGDANLDGEFNSSDLVAVFEAGQYEDGVLDNSTWATGDWNGDAEFSTSDLVLAFQDGGYEFGPNAAVNTVPEPASVWLLGLGAMVTTWLRHR